MSLTSILSSNPLTKKNQAKGKPMADKNWMDSAVSHPGALHRALGISTSKKIPAEKLAAALKSKNPKIRKMAQLAKTFAKFRKG